jgi:hypothetical protein
LLNVIDRMVDFAFGGGRLLDFLTKRRVDTLIISGGETDVCVLSTLLSAVDLGYRIILVEGALCSSSDESHDAILCLYRQRFDSQVGVADVERILGLVEAGVKRPARVLGMPRPKPGRSRPPTAIVPVTFTRPGPGNHASEPGVVVGVCSLNNPGTALCGVA